MIAIRRAGDRGHAAHGWLDSRHTFSFGDYHDARHMGFRALRVINEDRVQPGEGFGTHGHRDMEIVTYVIGGALAHRDSLGSGSVMHPGDVQRMSAGTGVTHSEYNASSTDPVHFLQVWILPEREGLPPSYEQKAFPEDARRGRLRLIASRDGRDGSLTIHQDVTLFDARLEPGDDVGYRLGPGRHAWVQVVRGVLALNAQELRAGDGAAVRDQEALRLAAREPAELLLFDLA